MVRPKFAPKSTPSRGPIPKPHYLPYAWTRPTYMMPVGIRIWSAISLQCPKYCRSKIFVRAEGDAAASPLDPPLYWMIILLLWFKLLMTTYMLSHQAATRCMVFTSHCSHVMRFRKLCRWSRLLQHLDMNSSLDLSSRSLLEPWQPISQLFATALLSITHFLNPGKWPTSQQYTSRKEANPIRTTIVLSLFFRF